MAWATQETALVRTVVYPVLLLINLQTIWLMLQGYRQQRDRAVGVLLLATLALTVAGAHDFLYIKGLLSLDDFFWFPWVTPLIFLGIAVYLLQRLFRALGEAEELNVQLEQRVTERTADLQAAHRAQTQFIAAASHDLRQPLHTIGLLMANLRERLTHGNDLQLLAKARSALQSMDNLLHGILDISRLDSGIDQPDIEPLALANLWASMGRTFAPEAARLGLKLRLRPTALWVASDVHMLQRVLNNLVSNALRYTNHGGVLVTARARGDTVLIQVWDTGIGIAREQQDKVFLEFVQLDNPQRDRNQGMGLGLAIVRRTLNLLNLGMDVHSRPGRGSVFSMSVPRVVLPTSAHAHTQSAPPPDVSGLFVLMLDDEQDALHAMQGLLKDWGCAVGVASNGAQALAVLDKSLREPDALLLDYRLPGENGLTIGNQLLEAIGRRVPVLIITGDVASHPIQRIAASGFDVLHKPVDTMELRSWLAHVKATADASLPIPFEFTTGPNP
jgi:signal transduction histidine kinase/CheY-like chemotaxis protein